MVYFNSRLNSWLSNFEGSVGGYKTLEHGYQAILSDNAREVCAALTPGDAKRIGGRSRSSWGRGGEVRRLVMWGLLRLKFRMGVEYGVMLLGTGDDELVHWCPWGGWSEWGIGVEGGENWLGVLLMRRREELRELFAKKFVKVGFIGYI